MGSNSTESNTTGPNSTEVEVAVEAQGLVKHFGDVRAVDGIDLVVPRGEVVGLLGPNGSGKTTTVRILATLLRATSGTARVAGFDVVKEANQVRRAIGLTGQYAAIDEFLTGRENLMMFGSLYHLDRDVVRSRVEELLERFDLQHAAKRPAKTYSGGMRRRLDLAASLVGRPGILFLDEPTTGLDPRSRIDLWAVITELVAEGTTVLLTTQYLDEADKLADDIVVIDHGKVIAHGTSGELKDQIGGDRLEIRLVDAADEGVVVKALATVVSGEAVVADNTYSAPISGGSTVLVSAVRALDSAGVTVADIGLRRPTLDDVFLSLTGRRAEEDGDVEEESKPAPKGRGRSGRWG